MKILLFLFLFFISVFSAEFQKPIYTLKASGYVIDLLYKDGKIYTATDAGVVDVFNYKTKKIIKQIKVPKVKDFMGDSINSRVFSVDELYGVIMLLSKSKDGFNRIHLHVENKNQLIIDYKQRLAIIKAKFLNKGTLLLALLSNEIISYDIKNKKENYRIQVNGSKFSDFAINENKTKVVVTDESGIVTIINTKTGKIIEVLKAENLDNVFQISYKNTLIATAGQDRRIAIYAPKFKSSYFKKAKFIVYSVGLSPNGKLCAYASDENNNISVFNTLTKSSIAKYTGNISKISDIEFINEQYFLVASNSKSINLYKIK